MRCKVKTEFSDDCEPVSLVCTAVKNKKTLKLGGGSGLSSDLYMFAEDLCPFPFKHRSIHKHSTHTQKKTHKQTHNV